MPHAEVLVAPALMLADYYLTMLGARLFGASAEARAAYELNPMMRGVVGRLAPTSPRHLLATVAVGAALWSSARIDPVVTRFFLGLIVGGFALLIGGHVTNILTLTIGGANESAGRISATYRRRLMTGAFRSLGGAVPILVIAAFEPTLFALGAAAGALVVAATPIFWRQRATTEELDKKVAIGPEACGFCGADAATAKKLIAGDGAMICDECVGTCVEALADDAETTEPETAASPA